MLQLVQIRSKREFKFLYRIILPFHSTNIYYIIKIKNHSLHFIHRGQPNRGESTELPWRRLLTRPMGDPWTHAEHRRALPQVHGPADGAEVTHERLCRWRWRRRAQRRRRDDERHGDDGSAERRGCRRRHPSRQQQQPRQPAPAPSSSGRHGGRDDEHGGRRGRRALRRRRGRVSRRRGDKATTHGQQAARELRLEAAQRFLLPPRRVRVERKVKRREVR